MTYKLVVASTAPDFDFELDGKETTFSNWLDNDWGILYSYFEDCRPTLTGEDLSAHLAKFDKPNLKTLGYTLDPYEVRKNSVFYDKDSKVANLYANSLIERVLYVISPKMRIELSFVKTRPRAGITRYFCKHLASTNHDDLVPRFFGTLWA